jgi:hypothetical protein
VFRVTPLSIDLSLPKKPLSQLPLDLVPSVIIERGKVRVYRGDFEFLLTIQALSTLMLGYL